MKKQNLIKKVAVISSILTSLSGSMFAMNTTPPHNLYTIHNSQNKVDTYKTLANKIVEEIANAFYPKRGQAMDAIGTFWNERLQIDERNVIMFIVARNNSSNKFDLRILHNSLNTLEKVNINLHFLFAVRDKKLLEFIASSFKEDRNLFCKLLFESWNELQPYSHGLHIEREYEVSDCTIV